MIAALRRGWDRITIYLPVILMGVLAMGTWWAVRNTPLLAAPETEQPPRHEPDYFMRGFSVKTFDGSGRMKSEIFGAEARHYPDTDTLEIDQVRMRSINKEGRLTTATANRALSNGDGSEVQLFGNAIVVRDEAKDEAGKVIPRLEFRGEFLHAFIDTERVKSHLPVVLTRGTDQFTADSLAYDNLDRVADLKGRVRGILTPSAAQPNP